MSEMLTPDQWTMVKSQAKVLAESRLFDRVENRQEIRLTPEQATAIVMFGLDLRVGATATLMNVSIMRGKLSMKTDFMVGLACRVGRIDPVMEESDDTKAVVRFQRNDWPQERTLTYTWEQAKKMGVTEKNAQYKTQPAVMLMHRARAAAARLVAPDMLAGIYSSEGEAEDIEAEDRPQRQDPPRHQGPSEGGLSAAEQAKLDASLRPASELSPPEDEPATEPPTDEPVQGSFDADAALQAEQAREPEVDRQALVNRVGRILLNRCQDKKAATKPNGDERWKVTGDRSKDRDGMCRYLAREYKETKMFPKDWSIATLQSIDQADRVRTMEENVAQGTASS